jgi:hypothetical protein
MQPDEELKRSIADSLGLGLGRIYAKHGAPPAEERQPLGPDCSQKDRSGCEGMGVFAKHHDTVGAGFDYCASEHQRSHLLAA